MGTTPNKSRSSILFATIAAKNTQWAGSTFDLAMVILAGRATAGIDPIGLVTSTSMAFSQITEVDRLFILNLEKMGRGFVNISKAVTSYESWVLLEAFITPPWSGSLRFWPRYGKNVWA